MYYNSIKSIDLFCRNGKIKKNLISHIVKKKKFIKQKNANDIIKELNEETTNVKTANLMRNKLNKSNSVSYRGNANTELSKYGTVFKIKAHPKTANLFILEGENKQGDFSSDENIELPEDYDIENDISIDDFIEEASSISSMDFSIDNI